MDNKEEIFPMVDENDVVIGKVTRKEANSNPNIIHRAVGIFIFNSNGEILIQKRSESKDTFPGCWDISLGGHVDYGEEYLNAALREVKEELGLELINSDLKLLGKLLVKLPWENEFWEIYRYDLKEGDVFNLNEEVNTTKFINLSDLKESLLDPDEKWSDKARQQFEAFLFKKDSSL